MIKSFATTAAVFMICLVLQTVCAQRLPIENFNVDNGLSQSQVTCITQDIRNYLWIGTIAGLNRFDGVRFKTFSKSDGINSNNIMALYSSRKGDIWIATAKGLSKYNGYRFENLQTTEMHRTVRFNAIAEDASGNIYACSIWQGLFMVKGRKLIKLPPPEEGKNPTCMYTDRKNGLWVYINGSGFYRLLNEKWTKMFELSGLRNQELIRQMTEGKDCYYAITNQQAVLKIEDGRIVQRKEYKAFFLNMCLNDGNNLWVASSKGIAVFDDDDLAVKKNINALSGLSDNMIHTIYKDIDGNFWIGSDGDGLFKYCSGSFVKYDKNTGLTGNVVMGLSKAADGSILLGTREGGIQRYDSKNKTFRRIDYTRYSTNGINCMGADARGTIYIATTDNRLLKITGSRVSEIMLEKKYHPAIYTIKAYDDKVLVHTTMGGYWLGGNKATKIDGASGLINSIRLNQDELLTAGDNGMAVYSMKKKKFKKLYIQGVDDDINVSCFERLNNYIVIGTFDEGLFFWDPVTNKVLSCNRDNGLKDNTVFALMKDSRGNLWTGTSSGMQWVQFNAVLKIFYVKQFNIGDGYEPSETNLNAIIEDPEHNVWMGTTKGVFLYNPVLDKKRDSGRPVVVIEAVDYPEFKKTTTDSFSAWEHLPLHPQIAFGNNSISFSFKGIYLRDPAALLYSYQLDGYDAAFSPLRTETTLNYKSLPPGQYIFKVKAFTQEGIASADTFEYPFTIITPYYKTSWFKGLMVVALILIGGGIQLIYANEKRKRRKEIRQIKEQEQQKIREQTAADFHDELGNKLTRISLLADLLQQKTDPKDQDKNKIISQIKSNALQLYSGTKEIIWSLSKESDNLKDVLIAIRQAGVELFSDTNVQFELTGLADMDADIKIPPGYNRNIIMIFKELLSNSMRHAQATKVSIECRNEGPGLVGLYFTDDGVGFDKAQLSGNGLNNIKRRAEKIGGNITINSAKHLGAACCLIFSVSPNYIRP